MGKKKSTTIEITPPADDEPTPEELVELNVTEGGELFRVTDELKATQGVRLMFVRTYPAGPDSAGYVGEMTPGEFTTERVRELYGPGKYKVTIMGPRGILPGGGSITIAKGVERPKGLGGTGDVAELIRALEERQAQQRAASSARWDKIMELAIPGMFTVLAGLVGKGGGGTDVAALVTALKPAPGPSLADLTTTLANIQALQKGSGDGMSGLEGLLKAAQLLKEFAGEGGGGGDGKSGWIDVLHTVVKEVAPGVRPMLEQAAAAAAARAQPALPAPAPASAPMPPPIPGPVPAAAAPKPTPTPAAAEPTITEGADMWEMAKPIIRAQVDKLLGWAAAKGRVDLYAELFLTELPQIVAKYVTPQQALTWLQSPEWWTVVRAHYPELEPHYAWLDQFRSELILLVEEQIAEAGSSDAAG